MNDTFLPKIKGILQFDYVQEYISTVCKRVMLHDQDTSQKGIHKVVNTISRPVKMLY